MRILLLNNLYPPYVEGGAEILARDVATGLERLGHEVLVLTSSFGLAKAEQDGQIWRTLKLAPSAHFDRQRPLWRQLDQPYNYYRRYHYPANADELRRVVAMTQPDILYLWEVAGLGVNSLLKALPGLKIPIVFHLGSYVLLYANSPETEQSHLHNRWLKQRLIGTLPALTCTSLIAVSAAVKQQYVQAGFDAESIEVIYNGIDPHFLSLPQVEDSASKDESKSERKECFQLLFVGRLRDEKGILIILKALDLLLDEQSRQKDTEQPFLHLHIFGTGDKTYVRELEAFLDEKHLTHVVTFHGKVSQDELIRYYDCSDIMLVPSLWQEPFGLVVAEAMARGLPVIASNIGGPAEILTHDVSGLLIEPGDEQALASAITQLLENPQQRALLAAAARTTVQERFTIEKNARRVEQHLLRAIQRDQKIGINT
ncbi:MAG: glycosyltransferase family 4 protein [Ktedonobacteraceae bacterium]